MGVDYRWGTGYGIAIPLQDEWENPEVCAALSNFFGVQTGEGGIYTFDGLPEVTDFGLDVDIVGDSWSNNNWHALILDKDTVKRAEIEEIAGVHGADREVHNGDSLKHLSLELARYNIPHKHPQWLFFGSIS